MRLTTKRLPNIFSSAPSNRFSSPTGGLALPLRAVPPSAIAATPEPPRPAPEPAPVFSAPFEPAPAQPEPAGEEPALEETASDTHSLEFLEASASATFYPPETTPEALASEPAPLPQSEPLSSAPEGQQSGSLPTVPPGPAAAGPAVTARRLVPPTPPGQRFNAAPVPLSRLTRTERHSLGRGFWILLAVLILVLLGLLYLFGLTPRIVAGRELDHEQKFSTERIVAFGVARLATPHVELALPGTIEASQQASLYARTNGYVKKWLVDIGDHVTTGQLLAELDTPEVDQQLAQARAAVAQADAGLKIAQSAAQRWDTMAAARAVSQEDADEKDAARNEAQANFIAAQANLARLTDLENFKEIRAPFPGRITYRNIDVGSLVTAGVGAPNSELFRLAQTDPLRVYVDVPEASSPAIKPGVEANLQVNSYPGRIFHGEVVRDAGALSDTSRTLHTEIRVANPDGALLPGAFAEVRLQLLDSAPSVLIPVSALIVNASGTSVALLEDRYGQDVVHYTPVLVGRDFGTEVEILNHVNQGDRLVTNPPADLNEGATVTAKPADQPPAPSVVTASPASPRA
jgi:multidrug efflux system membrane fusion protein